MRRSQGHGFTLIELLVVIAIIAILAAILFPVFAKARSKARQAACISNEKQIGTAIMSYSQDFDEAYPAIASTADPLWQQYNWGWWEVATQPYIKNKQVFACPEAIAQFCGPSTDRYPEDYGYNEYPTFSGNGWSTQAALAGSKNGVAQVVLAADSAFAGIFNDWSNDFDPDKTNYLSRIAFANGTNKLRHEGSNAIFCDGHAKYLPAGKIRCPASRGTSGQYPIVNPDANILN